MRVRVGSVSSFPFNFSLIVIRLFHNLPVIRFIGGVTNFKKEYSELSKIEFEGSSRVAECCCY